MSRAQDISINSATGVEDVTLEVTDVPFVLVRRHLEGPFRAENLRRPWLKRERLPTGGVGIIFVGKDEGRDLAKSGGLEKILEVGLVP